MGVCRATLGDLSHTNFRKVKDESDLREAWAIHPRVFTLSFPLTPFSVRSVHELTKANL